MSGDTIDFGDFIDLSKFNAGAAFDPKAGGLGRPKLKGAVFVPRPTTADFDWELSDLTADGSFHDLSFSSIVPADTQVVIINVRVKGPTIGEKVKFRRKGGGAESEGAVLVQASNVFNRVDLVVALDDNRAARYRLDNNTDLVNCDITAKGWFF